MEPSARSPQALDRIEADSGSCVRCSHPLAPIAPMVVVGQPDARLRVADMLHNHYNRGCSC